MLHAGTGSCPLKSKLQGKLISTIHKLSHSVPFNCFGCSGDGVHLPSFTSIPHPAWMAVTCETLASAKAGAQNFNRRCCMPKWIWEVRQLRILCVVCIFIYGFCRRFINHSHSQCLTQHTHIAIHEHQHYHRSDKSEWWVYLHVSDMKYCLALI